MKTYECRCGNMLFFDNTSCVVCKATVGWCEACHRVASFQERGGKQVCQAPGCGAPLTSCANRVQHDTCNRMTADGPLCGACKLTVVIPDLSQGVLLERWRAAEVAKRRLLYELDELALPYTPPRATVPLKFEFKADTPDGHVTTGHADGVITLNLREADSVIRERTRRAFGEPHRTLIGHLRHEVGHYFWQTLVDGVCGPECAERFGDPAGVDYAEALGRYYEAGPPDDWQAHHVSPYASSHPWEDFAETFGFYLDVRSVLATAGATLAGWPAPPRGADVRPLLKLHHRLGVAVNELNRTMGLVDLIPEVVAPPVVEKLAFVHGLVNGLEHGPAGYASPRSAVAAP